MEDSFLPHNLAIFVYDIYIYIYIFSYFNHIQNFNFLTDGKDITASLRLRSTNSTTTRTLWGHYYGTYGLSEHKRCDKSATNKQNGGKFAGKRGYGAKSTGRVWAPGFHHVTTRSRLARVLKLTKRLFL